MKLQILLGICVYVTIGIYSNWQTAVAIFITMWANNIDQAKVKK